MTDTDGGSSTLGRQLEGWRAIAAHVAARIGFDISVDSTRRWSLRGDDPLPVRRWGGLRPHVVADTAALDEGVARQWRKKPSQEEEDRRT